MGGRKKKFNTLTEMFYLWCIDHNIIFSSAHIAGSESLTADRLSRDSNKIKNGNLTQIYFIRFLTYLVCPLLFASSINKQVPHILKQISNRSLSKLIISDQTLIKWK